MSDKYNELRDLKNQLRAIAVPVGPLHAYWDLILDIEAFLELRPTTITLRNADDWITLARAYLPKRRNCTVIDGECACGRSAQLLGVWAGAGYEEEWMCLECIKEAFKDDEQNNRNSADPAQGSNGL